MAGQHAKESFTSPKGNLLWCFITGEGRKDKYSTVVKVLEEDAKEAMAAIDLFWKENKPKQAKPRPKSTGYKYEENEETGEHTGYVLFSFSTGIAFPSGDKKIVKVFRAKPPVVELDLQGKMIGDKSVGRAIGSLSIFEYEGTYGTTLYLDALSLSSFTEYVGGVDESSVTADEDGDDMDFEAKADVSSVSDEAPTEAPRV